MRYLCLFLGAVLLARQPQSPPRTPDAARTLPPELVDKAQIVVHVEGHPDLTVTAADLATMPQHKVTAHEHGNAVEYEGVYLHDVLAKAGAPFGSELKGKALSSYVLATAKDGYQVVYTLTEMDTDFSDGDLLIADKSNGAALSPSQGPFRIVASHDKKPARSLRMVERIDVVQLRK